MSDKELVKGLSNRILGFFRRIVTYEDLTFSGVSVNNELEITRLKFSYENGYGTLRVEPDGIYDFPYNDSSKRLMRAESFEDLYNKIPELSIPPLPEN